ncbi:MAG: ribosomal protein S18-alanine N-acetyltransferase [Eubacteriales bacterium]|jgi:ribosomal-protein-alanine N-acetyltransferase
MEFEIIRLSAKDIPFVAEIEKKCFLSPWSERSFKASFNCQAAVWFGALNEGRLIGFCGAQIVAPEGEIINIAVDPQFRRNGVGEALLRKMLDTCSVIANIWFLDVRESNTAAQALYKKIGFFTAGKRIGYYAKPREDALVMKLDLSNRRPFDADSFI